MNVLLGVTTELVGGSPRGAIDAIRATKVFPIGRRALRVVVNELESVAPIELVQVLEEYKIRVSGFNFDVDLSGVNWAKPDPLYIAAELTPDQIVDLDDGNVFDPELPAPCKGRIAYDAAIRIAENPTGHMCGAKNDVIVSDRILEFLGAYAEVDTTPVLLHKRGLSDWHRLKRLGERVDVIRRDALEETACRACGVLGLFSPGVLIGHALEGLTVGENSLGRQHGRIVKSYIISVGVAGELVRSIPKGYGLSPVIDAASSIGNRLIELLLRLRRLARLP